MKLPPLKCPGCGRNRVPIKKGRIGSHLTPGGVRCAWTGFSESQARAWRQLAESDRK